jgi:(p)ppGpp synthase/HD superfamily hydrolase
MNELEKAITIAAAAHSGQTGKGGEPLILHPLRMMLRCGDPAERLTAVLHDVVEKSAWTLDALRAEGFPAEVVAAVDALTRRDGEAYLDYVRRAAAHPLGRVIKVLDLEDHIERTRSVARSSAELTKLDRYADALDLLKAL